MSTAIFDTLQYAKKLKKAGVQEVQAEAQAEALAEIFEKQVSTKDDINNLSIKIDLKSAELKAELIKWVIGVGVAQFLAFVSYLKYLH